ncbi:MAG TPA: hypothetical protein VKV95_01225 [Terriglobia bacterium]|nr:hypothetical protein [Terriglobia bacterium]
MKKSFFQPLALLFFSAALMGASPERWIHVRVESSRGANSNVSFNVPIQMAEAVLPTIPTGHHQGKFNLQASVNGMDLRAMLEAIRNSPDNVFVTVERHDTEISVAKAGRNMLIKFAEKPNPDHHVVKTVAIKVPIPVVRAMLTANSDELDVGAGIRALAQEGDVDVTVNDEKETVRVWTDTRTNSD